MKVLDLFSGIGGFSLGLERAGMETVAFCEIDPFCQKVLRKHWPDVPIFDDVTKLRGADIGPVDVICGGFPCQDLSIAGKQEGIDAERSGLWSEIVRLAGELRPSFVIVENVANLLAGPSGQPGRWFGRILGDLAAFRFDAEWHCIPASALGAPHNRDRVWIVAYPVGGQRRQEPLFRSIGRMGGEQQPFPWDGGWEAALARVRGMDDGLSGRVVRTDAIRNAVVPQIPEMLGRAIMEASA